MIQRLKSFALRYPKLVYICLDVPMFFVSFGFVVLTGNMLTPENIGLFNGALGVFTILFTVGFALQTVIARRIAAAGEIRGVQDFVKATTITSIIVAIPFLALTLGLPTLSSLEAVGQFSFIFLIIMNIFICLFRGILQGTERFYSLWAAQALEHVFRIIVLLLYAKSQISLEEAWDAVLIAAFIHLFYAGFSMPKSFWQQIKIESQEQDLGREIFAIIMTNLFLNILLSIDIIIAGELLESAGGAYVTANKFGRILYFIGVSVGVVILPTFSRAITTPALRKRILLSTFAIIPVSALLSPLGAFIVDPIIQISFPPEVIPSIKILSWTFFANFALASIHLFITWHIAQQTRYLSQVLGICCLILAALLWYGPSTELYLIQAISYSVWILTIVLAFIAYGQQDSPPSEEPI